MAISPINNVNNIRNLSFVENKEKPETEKKSQISTQTKVIVGTGLAALASVGIYLATKGKGKVKPQTLVDEVKNSTNNTQLEELYAAQKYYKLAVSLGYQQAKEKLDLVQRIILYSKLVQRIVLYLYSK